MMNPKGLPDVAQVNNSYFRDPSPKFDPEEYQRLLLANEATLGKHYVVRQLEWSEYVLEQRLAAGGVGTSVARTATQAAKPAVSTVCASSDLSSGGVVAPQIGLNRETPARKSHG